MIKWLLQKIRRRYHQGEVERLERQRLKYVCLGKVKKDSDLNEVLTEMAAEILEQFPAIDHNDPNFAIKMAKLQGEFDALYNGLLLEIENSDQLLKNTDRELDIFKERHKQFEVPR